MPISVLFLLIVAGVITLFRKRKITGITIIIISFCWFLVISTRPVPSLLTANLENKYKQLNYSILENLPDTVNIIVLGAGHTDDLSLSPNNQLSTNALGRLVEAIRIFRGVEAKGHRGPEASGDGHQASGGSSELRASSFAKPRMEKQGSGQGKCKLVVSGYSGKSKLSQAEVLYNTALMLGIDSAALVKSERPSNTREEAEEYVKLFGTEETLVLVTSAIHMPRAVMTFERAGVKVIPAPTNFLIKHGTVKNPWRWVPKAQNILIMEQAIHEYAGILWYNITLRKSEHYYGKSVPPHN